MDLLSVVNNQLENIYAKEEIQSTKVTADDINKIEATKFADTFEDFFMEGKGIDVLKSYYK